MIPPVEVVREAARQIELEVHKDGWDSPPVLMRLSGLRLGTAMAVAATEVPFRTQIPDGNPAVYLRLMADQFGDGHMLSEAARAIARDDFCGFAFICEGWMRTSGDPDELTNTARTRRYADIPGSVEIRNVTIVDTAGRVTSCLRERGKPPTVAVSGVDDGIEAEGGRVPAALRDMTLAVALHMPLGSADLDALRGLDLKAARG